MDYHKIENPCSDCDGRGFTYWGEGTPGNGFDVAPEPPEQECCQSCAGSGILPAEYVMVPIKPTPAIIKAMAESRAVDDEGEFPLMVDLLDFSGENKARTALEAAYIAAVLAAPRNSYER